VRPRPGSPRGTLPAAPFAPGMELELFELTNSPGHLWRDKWTALSGPLSLFLQKGGQQRGTLPAAPFAPGGAGVT